MNDWTYVTNGVWTKAYDDKIHIRKVHENGHFEYFTLWDFELEKILQLYKNNKINVLRDKIK